MIVGGLQRFSLVDYPGTISAVVFTQGCNFRCPYCHNPQLVYPERFELPLSLDEVFHFLQSRVGKLQAVVISGGEPLLHQDLLSFVQAVKSLGYQIKIDTNGSFPDALAKLVSSGLVDFIAMDIKAPLDYPAGQYTKLAGVAVDISAIRASIEIIKNSGLRYVFRTTLAEPLLKLDDIQAIRAELGWGIPYRVQSLNPYCHNAYISPL